MTEAEYFKQVFAPRRSFWLEKVSRTFTLSINILPPDLKEFVGHAYLICRLLDTLEDAPDLPVQEKIVALDLVIRILENKLTIADGAPQIAAYAAKITAPEYEKELLLNAQDIFRCLELFPVDAQNSIRRWAAEMGRGMQKYAFGADRPFPQLATLDELDEYTYFVAGTVGKLLSELFLAKTGSISNKNRQIIENNCLQFGKALQFVNILKDCRADIQEGRCYLPAELFTKYNCSLDDFVDSKNSVQVAKIFVELNSLAEGYLDNALNYISALPLSQWRIRLFCIWPVVLAYKTLGCTQKNLQSMLSNSFKLKIKRSQVKRTVLGSYPGAFSNIYLRSYLKLFGSF